MKKLSEEHKRKLSLAKMGSKNPRFGKPSPMRGKKFPKEVGLKISMAKIGKPLIRSEEGKKSFSEKTGGANNYAFGKKFPERSGEKHPRWIKDRTQLKDEHKDRGGTLHRDWSKSVKNRDKWTCRIADVNCDGRLEAHHILSWKDYPELRYVINNGITLCHAHHPRKKVDEINMIDFFQNLLTIENKVL